MTTCGYRKSDPRLACFYSGAGSIATQRLFIVVFHQYWRSVAAVIISLLGWFLLLRGFVWLAASQSIVNGAEAATETTSATLGAVRAGFGLLALCGVYLTY